MRAKAVLLTTPSLSIEADIFASLPSSRMEQIAHLGSRDRPSMTDHLANLEEPVSVTKKAERQWVPIIDRETYQKVEDAYMQISGNKDRPSEQQLRDWVKENHFLLQDPLTDEGPLSGLKKEAFIQFGMREPSLQEQQAFVKEHRFLYSDPLSPTGDWEVEKFILFGTSNPSESQMQQHVKENWSSFIDPLDQGESALKQLMFVELGSNPSPEQKRAFIERLEKENGLKVYEKADGSLTLIASDSPTLNSQYRKDRPSLSTEGVHNITVESALINNGNDNGFRVQTANPHLREDRPGDKRNAKFNTQMSADGELKVIVQIPSFIEISYQDSKGERVEHTFATKAEMEKFLKESGIKRGEVSIMNVFDESPPKEQVVASIKIDPEALAIVNGTKPTRASGLLGELERKQAQATINNQIAKFLQLLDA